MAVESYLFSYAQRQKKKKNIFILLVSLVLLLIFLQLITMFVIRPLRITSPFMEPEFSQSSVVFVTPLINGSPLFSSSSSLHRGSMVTIQNGSVDTKTGYQSFLDFVFGMITFQRFRPFESERWGDSEVYRIVGLPGDTLYMDNYITYIKQGGDSHYLTEFELATIDYDIHSADYPENWNMSIGVQGKTNEIFLQKDEYFLLCDNRIISADSRFFGEIKKQNITAAVVAQYYPFNSIRAIK